jgi:hypothetical protein
MIGDSLGWALRHLAKIALLYLTGNLPQRPQNVSMIVDEILHSSNPIAFRLSGGMSFFKFVDFHNTVSICVSLSILIFSRFESFVAIYDEQRIPID